jgi:selenophosphate synthase
VFALNLQKRIYTTTKYSLHEPNVYAIAKGKDHKQYEYGNKASIVSTKDTNILVGVVEQEVFLISFKQAVCGKFALQFSDEFVGNGSKARKRIGVKGFNLIFKMSVALHGKQAQESSVLIDTTAS